MPQFQYQATSPQGKIVEGMMEAAEEHAVVARLHDQGYLPLQISPIWADPDKSPSQQFVFTDPADPAGSRRSASERSVADDS